MAAAGNPNITEELLKGKTIGGRTYKNCSGARALTSTQLRRRWGKGWPRRKRRPKAPATNGSVLPRGRLARAALFSAGQPVCACSLTSLNEGWHLPNVDERLDLSQHDGANPYSWGSRRSSGFGGGRFGGGRFGGSGFRSGGGFHQESRTTIWIDKHGVCP